MDLDDALQARTKGDHALLADEVAPDGSVTMADPNTGEVIEAPPAGITVDAAIVMLGQLMPRFSETLAGLSGFPVHTATIQERADMVTLHRMLEGLIGVAAMRRDAIDVAFRRGFAELGAKEFVLPDGKKVVYDAPRGTIVVRAEALRKALAEFIPKGGITKAELDDALPVTVSYQADNRRLNALVAKRGEEIAAVIEEHRERHEPSQLNGKVRFPK